MRAINCTFAGKLGILSNGHAFKLFKRKLIEDKASLLSYEETKPELKLVTCIVADFSTLKYELPHFQLLEMCRHGNGKLLRARVC